MDFVGSESLYFSFTFHECLKKRFELGVTIFNKVRINICTFRVVLRLKCNLHNYNHTLEHKNQIMQQDLMTNFNQSRTLRDKNFFNLLKLPWMKMVKCRINRESIEMLLVHMFWMWSRQKDEQVWVWSLPCTKNNSITKLSHKIVCNKPRSHFRFSNIIERNETRWEFASKPSERPTLANAVTLKSTFRLPWNQQLLKKYFILEPPEK